MQVAIVVATLGRAKDRELDVIAAASFVNRMQRLVQITHKVDEPFKRFQPVCPGSLFRRPGFFEISQSGQPRSCGGPLMRPYVYLAGGNNHVLQKSRKHLSEYRQSASHSFRRVLSSLSQPSLQWKPANPRPEEAANSV